MNTRVRSALMEMPQVAASPFLPNPLLIPVPPFVAMRMRAQPCICSGACQEPSFGR